MLTLLTKVYADLFGILTFTPAAPGPRPGPGTR